MAAKARIMEVRAWMRASAILNKGGAYQWARKAMTSLRRWHESWALMGHLPATSPAAPVPPLQTIVDVARGHRITSLSRGLQI
ncbi:hypothetical protein C5L14_02295 [Labrys okinawensis]|uniref:Uncharacterized protein n=1 Tax=Labrys okinawensis TaxID=346911 RepID=A0A2S9QJ95_9HYPH|nr:hypothetical protein C5L14_02295 [Labrys okinawensis]